MRVVLRLLLAGVLFAVCAPAEAKQRTAKEVFRDCRDCPDMVAIPGGEFMMLGDDLYTLQRTRVGDFAIGRTEVTFDQWAACVEGGGCRSTPNPDDSGWGRGQRPVINVSYADALEYAAWLSRKTRQHYRLPTDAEWEYGAQTPSDVTPSFTAQARESGRNMSDGLSDAERALRESTVPVGGYDPNWFGLHDYLGNVSEFVADGRQGFGPDEHVMRGAYWGRTHWDALYLPVDVAYRQEPRSNRTGFRIARDLAGVRSPTPIRMKYTGAEAPPLENGFYVAVVQTLDTSWTPAQRVPLHAAPASTAVVATAAAGETLKRLELRVLLVPLRGVVVERKGPFEVGAVVWLLEPESEGFHQIWYRGEKVQAEYPPDDAHFRWDPADAWRNSVAHGCWTRLQRPDGTSGWSNDAALGCDWIEGEQTSDDGGHS